MSHNHSDTKFLDNLISHAPFRGHQLKIIALCLIFNMVDGFDITAMAVVASDVGSEMQIGADKLGLIFSFSLAGMMIGSMFLASLSDLWGRRIVIITSLVCVGLSVLLTAYVHDLYLLIFLRFISGLGTGAMLASQAALAAEYSPEKYRALCVAMVTAGYPLGAMTTGLVASSVVADFGWRGMFIVGGITTLVFAGVALLFLSESLEYLMKKRPPNALKKINSIISKLNEKPIDALAEYERDSDGLSESSSILSNISGLLSGDLRKKTLILWLSFFMAMISMYFMMSWLPKLLTNEGFAQEVANHAFSMYNFGGVIGIFLIGIMASRWSLSYLISGFMLLAAAAMWAFSVSPKEAVLIYGVVFLIGVTLQGGFTGLYALGAKIYPVQVRSTGVGFAIGFGRLGAVIGPAVAGLLIASGVSLQLNFMIFAIPMLIGGLCILAIHIR